MIPDHFLTREVAGILGLNNSRSYEGLSCRLYPCQLMTYRKVLCKNKQG